VRVWRDAAPTRLLLYSADSSDESGWRMIRAIERDKGERGVEQGKMTRKYDPINRNLIGYQLVSTAAQRVDQDLRSQPSTSAISAREMQINAGEMGRSHTAGLGEVDRQFCDAPEDHIERVACKVKVYAYVTSEKGSILEVWPK
jgi:hypothetical protein